MNKGGGTLVTDFDEHFARLHREAYQAAYRILGERTAAEDIAQEALARAYARWRRVAAHAVPWVVRVASNLAIDVVRRRRRRESPFEEATPDPRTAERLDLQSALLRLPRRQREVVLLRYGADLSVADVAEVLHCSPGTVKAHAHRGLTALRSILDSDEEGEAHAPSLR